MATNIHQVQAFPARRPLGDLSLWQRIVAIFSRIRPSGIGEAKPDSDFPQASGASDSELRALAKSRRSYPEDRVRSEVLVNLYSAQLHS